MTDLEAYILLVITKPPQFFLLDLAANGTEQKKALMTLAKTVFFFKTILSIKHFYGFIQKGRVIHIDS